MHKDSNEVQKDLSANDKTPQVTIGLPFSGEPLKYLQLAVQSIFAQKFENWELILISDNAKPELLSFAKSIQDPRVQIVHDGKQLGLATRLNQLATMAKGTFLTRMDADDIMHPDRISKSVEFLEQNPTVQIISTNAIQIDENSQVVGEYHVAGNVESRYSVFITNPIIHPSVMSRKQWSLENPYNQNFQRAQDKELWVRSLTSDNFSLLEEELIFYRVLRGLTYKKHAKSNSFDRKIIRLHGPTEVGTQKTVFLLLRSITKQMIFGTLLLLGKQDLLYKRRYSDWNDTESRLAAESVIAEICKVSVPQ